MKDIFLILILCVLATSKVTLQGQFAKKAEIANILFNIMNEKRAKRGYKCRKGIAAFREGYEQHGRQYGVKRDGKKNGKRC